MTPKNATAGPLTGAGAATNHVSAPQEQRPHRSAGADNLVVAATLFLATGNAAFDWMVVRKCPFCGHAHRHVVFERGATTIERAPSCARHRLYTVTASSVVPSDSRRAA
ncbi:hypothetical protein [Pseudonocardia sp. TRM90224]|uniref:hypothetical protein n=1 Tax=Pseudonocardia sp. TRM90224 TaxID=2812678 RepID=UPI001E4DD5F2|nr:hypothetical protein [Pseudonocardia sp. TRM90224]